MRTHAANIVLNGVQLSSFALGTDYRLSQNDLRAGHSTRPAGGKHLALNSASFSMIWKIASLLKREAPNRIVLKVKAESSLKGGP
jgi:hypothetical protein